MELMLRCIVQRFRWAVGRRSLCSLADWHAIIQPGIANYLIGSQGTGSSPARSRHQRRPPGGVSLPATDCWLPCQELPWWSKQGHGRGPFTRRHARMSSVVRSARFLDRSHRQHQSGAIGSFKKGSLRSSLTLTTSVGCLTLARKGGRLGRSTKTSPARSSTNLRRVPSISDHHISPSVTMSYWDPTVAGISCGGFFLPFKNLPSLKEPHDEAIPNN